MDENVFSSDLVIHLEDIENHEKNDGVDNTHDDSNLSNKSKEKPDHETSNLQIQQILDHLNIFIFLILFISGLICSLIYATITKINSKQQVIQQSLFDFVYINDIHLDPKYIPSSSPQTFCREFDSKYASAPYYFGQYSCDTPILTFNSMLRFLTKKIYPHSLTNEARHPKFIVLGGDMPAHVLGYSMKQLHSFIGDMVHNISYSFNQGISNIPIVFVLGNNEYVPNYGKNDFSSDIDNFASLYENVIDPYILKNISIVDKESANEQRSTFLKGGYYYYDIPECNLRILSVNSIIYNAYRTRDLKLIDPNGTLNFDLNDPYGQFEWILSTSLRAKNEHNYTVGMALHLPPGMTYTTGDYAAVLQGWHKHYIDRFDEILAQANIEFILGAHSHYDMFLPVNGKDSKSKLFSLAAPSVSPQHLNNPGFRIFKIKSSGEVDDYDQYYADIMKNPQPRFHLNQLTNKTAIIDFPNSKSILANPQIYFKYDDHVEIGLKWFLSYSFKDAYGTKKKENVDYFSDFDDYDDDVLFEPKKVIKSVKMKREIGVNKETLNNAVDWIASTSEGRWRYKERVCNLAADYGMFYYCILACTTQDQLQQCLGPQYNDATYDTLKHLLPYNGERL